MAGSTSGSGSWRGVVQHDGHELADGLQAVATQGARLVRGRRAGTRRGRTPLRRGRSRHLGQHGLGASWWPQPGTSQTPQEIGAPAIAIRSSGDDPCQPPSSDLVRSTVRPSRRESSQASAIRNAWRASATVHGDGIAPARDVDEGGELGAVGRQEPVHERHVHRPGRELDTGLDGPQGERVVEPDGDLPRLAHDLEAHVVAPPL